MPASCSQHRPGNKGGCTKTLFKSDISCSYASSYTRAHRIGSAVVRRRLTCHKMAIGCGPRLQTWKMSSACSDVTVHVRIVPECHNGRSRCKSWRSSTSGGYTESNKALSVNNVFCNGENTVGIYSLSAAAGKVGRNELASRCLLQRNQWYLPGQVARWRTCACLRLCSGNHTFP